MSLYHAANEIPAIKQVVNFQKEINLTIEPIADINVL